MVQYYRPVLLAPDATEIRGWIDPAKYGQDPTVMGQSNKDSPFIAAIEMLLRDKGRLRGSRLVWAGDYAETEGNTQFNLFKMCSPDVELVPEEADASYYGYIVNHTKRQFVSKDRSEKYTNLHPLPLLTAEGSGYGPGDYPKEHALVGHWARDVISVEKKRPDGYIEIIFDLV